jgi:dephospho-CoA kinase
VVEAAVLIEANWLDLVDEVWVVQVPEAVAKQRLMARNGFSEEEANQRLSSQRDWRLRAPAADFVLHNDGTLEDMLRAVRAEFERIRALKMAGTLPPSVYHAWRAENPLPQAAGATRSE